MISVTSDMIFRATIFSLFLGMISGGVCALTLGLTKLLIRVLKRKRSKCDEISHSLLFQHIFDFIFALFVGIGYFLILYVFVDGMFYFITLCSLFVGFILSQRTVNKFFE